MESLLDHPTNTPDFIPCDLDFFLFSKVTGNKSCKSKIDGDPKEGQKGVKIKEGGTIEGDKIVTVHANE